ncbi:MAG: 4Fe-4S dicluster domain-containing protein [Ignavibacteriales bacterium]|nr:4Fe-4S dicluster domain-containing protein [Ignavibacteriales bacterium]
MLDKLDSKVSRRSFFKRSGGMIAGAAAASVVIPELLHAKEAPPMDSNLKDLNEITKMTEELAIALKKPVQDRKWAMVVDARKCVGCDACTVACIAENNLPPGITYRKVIQVEDGDYPEVKRFFKPTNCMQCEKPTCVPAANKVIPGSMEIRPDGIVAIDYDKMKGKDVFLAAKKACPYAHSLYFDAGTNYTDNTPMVQKYENRINNEYGKGYKRNDTINTTRKCHFCLHKIENGILPACVSTCIGRAMYFGDSNNSGSLIVALLKNNENFVINEGSKTVPKVRFVNDNHDQSCLKCHS